MRPLRPEAQPLSVLQLNDDLEVGGVERVVVNLAREMQERGLRVGVLAEDGGALWRDVPPVVEQYRLGPRGGLSGNVRWFRAIRRSVREDGWRVVHAHQRGLALMARLALAGTGVPVVEHVHSLFEPTPLRRAVSFRGHRLIACGSEVRVMLEEKFGRPSSRVSVITNAVVDPGARDLPEEREEQDLRVVGIGRLAEEKDPFRFVEVVMALRDLGVKCSGRWWGDGPLRDEVAAFVHSAGAGDFAEFPGVTANVGAEIASAHLVLLTSKREGLPLSILEGMGVGRAIVTSDVGSCRDVVEDGHTGIVYDPLSTVAEIAEQIESARVSGALEKYGQASRRKFVEECSIDVMTERVIAQYESALGR